MATYPGCCTTTQNSAESVTVTENGAESVGVMVNRVCGVERYPYRIENSAYGTVNLYGTSKKLIIQMAALGSVNLYGTSKKLVIIEGAKMGN